MGGLGGVPVQSTWYWYFWAKGIMCTMGRVLAVSRKSGSCRNRPMVLESGTFLGACWSGTGWEGLLPVCVLQQIWVGSCLGHMATAVGYVNCLLTSPTYISGSGCTPGSLPSSLKCIRSVSTQLSTQAVHFLWIWVYICTNLRSTLSFRLVLCLPSGVREVFDDWGYKINKKARFSVLSSWEAYL
jgi:hypothetical protein